MITLNAMDQTGEKQINLSAFYSHDVHKHLRKKIKNLQR